MEVRLTILFTTFLTMGAVSLWLAPLLSRRAIFFGVTVSPEFGETEDAKRILWDYRKLTLGVSMLSIAAFWVAVPYLRSVFWPLAFIATSLLQFGAAVAAFASAHNRARAFSKPSRSRTALLEPRQRHLPGGWIALAAPTILVVVAGIVLFERRLTMPGETFRGSFSSLLVAFFTDALTLVIGYLAVYRTRQIDTSDLASWENRRFRLGYLGLVFFAYFVTLFQIGIAFLTAKPLSPATGAGVPMFLIAFIAGVSIFALGFTFTAAQRRPFARDSADAAMGDSTPDDCWIWGIIYYNRDDPAFLVEKRVGFGWTLNYGNKWSWVFSIGLLAAPFVIRFFWFR
jgi:uncharacterized membrane protein